VQDTFVFLDATLLQRWSAHLGEHDRVVFAALDLAHTKKVLHSLAADEAVRRVK
jgi:uncharacterized protein YdeI (YjbR/CyaY-like superfamily)